MEFVNKFLWDILLKHPMIPSEIPPQTCVHEFFNKFILEKFQRFIQSSPQIFFCQIVLEEFLSGFFQLFFLEVIRKSSIDSYRRFSSSFKLKMVQMTFYSWNGANRNGTLWNNTQNLNITAREATRNMVLGWLEVQIELLNCLLICIRYRSN